MNTKRLISASYTPKLTGIKCRYEPTDGTKKIKEHHILNNLFCRSIDIKVSDRVLCNGKEFVVKECDYYDDALAKHTEVVMRELGSEFHETVQLKKLSATQGGYDAILDQYVGTKAYDTTNISVLIDEIESAKNTRIRIVDGGKLEDIDYIMTSELDQVFNSDDRVIRNGIEYEIRWIVTNVYQKLLGLKKSVVNYHT